MNSYQSQQTLERMIADAGFSLDRLSVEHGFTAMIDFYRHHRAEDCPAESDGDMLLYPWDFADNGAEKHFELDLTRQFMVGDAEDENIWQLSLTFKFDPIFLTCKLTPTAELRSLSSGNKWCHEPRAQELDNFESFIKGSVAYRAVASLSASEVELDYFNVG